MDVPLKIHYVKKAPSNQVRAISVMNKYHDSSKVLSFSFLDGSAAQKQHTRDGVQKIRDAVPGLKLEEVLGNGDVRISFNPSIGSWSYIGTDIFLIPKTEATMNLGWAESTHRVVIHEFGHTLNLVHEHLRGVNWDVPKVYEYFAQVGWTKEDVDNNILHFNEDNHEVSEIDLDSIMLYNIPCELTLDGKNCGRSNTKLSTEDVSRLNSMFPKNITEENPDDETTSQDIVVSFLKTLFLKEADLNRLLESQVVTIAHTIGVPANISDLKKNTIQKVWAKLNE